jgi:hypothetical protein
VHRSAGEGRQKIKQKGGDNMVSEEVVKKAVETLKGFSPEVLVEAIREIPEMGEALMHNYQENNNGAEAQLQRAYK